jgi:murein DD-endopeptidase MepM/ murein hydrolase activator NlpD
VRRLLTIGLVTALAPVAAWRASAMEPPPASAAQAATMQDATRTDRDASRAARRAARAAAAAPDCASTTTTTTTTTTTIPTTTPDTEPCESSTTAPPTTEPPTTTPPTEPTTTAPPTTAPDSTQTTTTPTTTTTTTSSPAKTTTTTTTTGERSTATRSVTRKPPTTTKRGPTRPRPHQPRDHDSDPVAPPVEVPSGRVVVPDGKPDPGQVRSITFPVAGPVTYSNDFGACRDGCTRAHKGNDLIGDRLQPIVAMHDGVIDHLVNHPTAGFGIEIHDSEGWQYMVYHMNNDSPGTDNGSDRGVWRFAPGIVPGATVKAGQFLGFMGDSGNSEGSVPHAHVEIHRPDGEAINPFWSLRLAQREVNCAAGSPRPDRVTGSDRGDAAAATPAGAGRSVGARRGAAARFLATEWREAQLPGTWLPLPLTGGHPSSDAVEARMWVGPAGFTPVDTGALQVGDARYDQPGDCDVADPITAPVPAELGAILATIRTLESGGDYTAESSSSTASGAYQFLDSTWRGYGGYARAKDAPPPVQDAAAVEHATRMLATNNGDVSTVPVSWYLGHVPVGAEWDTVPAVGANTLTPREYQARWLEVYAKYVISPTSWSSGAVGWTPQVPPQCRTVVTDLGPPGAPEYVLTQARAFRASPDGRAVVRLHDPCDPTRLPPATPPSSVDELPTTGGY